MKKNTAPARKKTRALDKKGSTSPKKSKPLLDKKDIAKIRAQFAQGLPAGQADTNATIRTKYGETVDWASWGPATVGLPAPKHGPASAQKRFARYPRDFRCTLANNHKGASAKIAEYDLYDIGAQRNLDTVEVTLDPNTTATNVTFTDRVARTSFVAIIGGGPYVIHEGKYDRATDEVTQGITLNFEGGPLIFWISRDVGRPDNDGSPPPPDPGDDSSEAP